MAGPWAEMYTFIVETERATERERERERGGGRKKKSFFFRTRGASRPRSLAEAPSPFAGVINERILLQDEATVWKERLQSPPVSDNEVFVQEAMM